MGKLLEEVLEASRESLEYIRTNIHEDLDIINKQMIERARNGYTSYIIKFYEAKNNCTVTPLINNECEYHIIPRLINAYTDVIKEYYTSEGFKVYINKDSIIISWKDKINGGE